jgi:peptidyl-dipeptidase Dcp
MVLSRGNTLDYAEMYRNFTGHDPDVTPMLEFYGLTGGAAPAPVTAPVAPAVAPVPIAPKKGERG